MLKEIVKCIEVEKSEYAIFVKSLSTEETYKFREDTSVSSASTIKVLIMSALMNKVKNGELSLSQRISVKEEDKVEFSVLTLLETGNSYTLKDVATLMIIESDNTATNILIDLLGMDYINSVGRELGLKNTILKRKMMDFTARIEGRDNYTTAEDLALLMELLYKKQAISPELDEVMIEILKQQQDKTMLYIDIPEEVIAAHKSGGLDNLQHETSIFYTDKGDFIFVMLVWNAESNNYAKKVIGKAAKAVYDYFTA